ncbi:MAG: hypothetical protein NVSMB53_18280 [Gemmatimonadaceae bacterium]
MRSPIIRATSVAKSYRVGGPRRPPGNLREALMAFVGRPREWLGSDAARKESETFWALDDVNFEVAPGEVLGVVGRNGAGKSTLLKVLSRVTEPTRGRIELRGRVASLLEVGTGFHAELTGRENIYMNGTILGMRKREIDQKLDAIVAFAEVERFLDTPVKRYSSGLYVRLAFAVAAHLEPEILIVDEVLAVGDAEFQRKCLGKMSDVAHQGRTVLFVSHNMAAVSALCTRAILLDRGRVALDGSVDTVVTRYLSSSLAQPPEGTVAGSYRRRGTKIAIEKVELLVSGTSTRVVQSGDSCTLRVHYAAKTSEAVGAELQLFIMLFVDGQKVVNNWTNAQRGYGVTVHERGYADCQLPRWPFRTSTVRVDVYSEVGFEAQDWIEELLVVDSHDGDFYGTGLVPHSDQGIMLLDHVWVDGTADGESGTYRAPSAVSNRTTPSET